ncbi:hypothetical protein BZ163_10775 [Pseudomonas sp. VI4.1]|nr:hypothetical protein BZ163_10775 [Pseudomonas sp. VI4.1]
MGIYDMTAERAGNRVRSAAQLRSDGAKAFMTASELLNTEDHLLTGVESVFISSGLRRKPK